VLGCAAQVSALLKTHRPHAAFQDFLNSEFMVFSLQTVSVDAN
jgi:hypothetical protein